jgi:hypothetical protein
MPSLAWSNDNLGPGDSLPCCDCATLRWMDAARGMALQPQTFFPSKDHRPDCPGYLLYLPSFISSNIQSQKLSG